MTTLRFAARGALAAFLLLAACDEQRYRHYTSAAQAAAAGERARGWLPAWLPASARDVHLQGDLDTNAWWVRADLSAAAADSLRLLLEPVSADSIRVPQPRRGAGWWFESLVQQHPENDGGLNADLFRGRGTPVPRTTVVAFDRTSSRVFAWTTVAR
jgi:hypothetical protein